MRRTRISGVGGEQKKKLQTRRFLPKFGDLATISPSYSDGTATAELKTGLYTYQGFQISIKSAVEIPGETIAADGGFLINTANFAKYISKVTLEIDGQPHRVETAADFLKFCEMRGHDVADGLHWMAFGGPHIYEDPTIEDAYMLGTKDVRSLKVLFDLTSEWADGQMFIQVWAEYVSAQRNLEFLRTTKSYRYAPAGAGEYTISDLPTHADIGAIYLLGDNIKSAELEVDGVKLEDANNYQTLGLNLLYGKDVAALGNGIVYDFSRSGELKGLKGLTTPAERKRNADIRITLDMLAAGEVQVVVDRIGRFATQL